jgi:hypothetical protein
MHWDSSDMNCPLGNRSRGVADARFSADLQGDAESDGITRASSNRLTSALYNKCRISQDIISQHRKVPQMKRLSTYFYGICVREANARFLSAPTTTLERPVRPATLPRA